MSPTLHDSNHVPEAGISDHPYGPYPPQSGPTQAIPADINFVDGSGPIFSMYLEMAGEEDKKMVEGWNADADGILIFTGLFSAAVASFISVSIQDIQPNSQDTSNFYLSNIYQVIADPNLSRLNISLPSSPPPFSPPTYAVCVNALWFLSLVISLTCALLATLLQQWARKYLKATQPPRYSPHKRARIRAFFFEGVERFLLSWVVEALPTLLHASLFLFFAGLVVFLCNINFTIFKLVLSWVGVCTALYGCIMLMPIFRHDCPYYTPLSSSVWPFVVGARYVFHWVRQLFASSNFRRPETFQRLRVRFHKMISQGMHRTAEETALDSSPEIDTRAFVWTLESLDEDYEMERFFSGLPGFRNSKAVDDPLPHLTQEQRWKLSTALTGLWGRTSSSDVLPDAVKKRRAIICAKAIDPTHTPGASIILINFLSNYRYSSPLAAEIVQIVRGWGSNRGEGTDLVVRAAVCSVVARVKQRDESWFILASRELGVPKAVLRDYATNGDSLSFSILIHIARLQLSHYQKWSWPSYAISNVLEAASKFNVEDTSLELQSEFCALWNQVVRKAQNDHNGSIAWYTLRPIHNIYAALHRETNFAPTRFSASTGDRYDIVFQPSSYPVCNAGHTHESRTVIDDDTALPLASLTAPDSPPSFAPVPPRVVESVMGSLSLNDGVSAPLPRHHYQTTSADSPRITATIPATVTVRATQEDIRTATPDTPARTPSSKLSTSPPDTLAIQHTADRRASSVVSDGPLSPSARLLDNMLHREPHSSMLAPTAPGPSAKLTSSSDHQKHREPPIPPIS